MRVLDDATPLSRANRLIIFFFFFPSLQFFSFCLFFLLLHKLKSRDEQGKEETPSHCVFFLYCSSAASLWKCRWHVYRRSLSFPNQFIYRRHVYLCADGHALFNATMGSLGKVAGPFRCCDTLTFDWIVWKTIAFLVFCLTSGQKGKGREYKKRSSSFVPHAFTHSHHLLNASWCL